MPWKTMQIARILTFVCLLLAVMGCINREVYAETAPPHPNSNDDSRSGGDVIEQNSQMLEEVIERKLLSELARDRHEALLLLNDKGICEVQKRKLLVQSLETEISSPSKGALVPEGISLPSGEFIKLRLSRKLGEEFPGEEIDKIIQNSSGELRERAILAKGFGGNREAIPLLEGLLSESASAWVRKDAAFLLGELGANESVNYLVNALMDTFQVEDQAYGIKLLRYPVRVKANSALKKLGVRLEKKPVLYEKVED